MSETEAILKVLAVMKVPAVAKKRSGEMKADSIVVQEEADDSITSLETSFRALNNMRCELEVPQCIGNSVG